MTVPQTSARRRREVLFITLIDILLQLLFFFLLAIYSISHDKNSVLLREAQRFTAKTGLSLAKIEEAWTRLVDPQSLDEKYHEFLKQRADYERLKVLEKEITIKEERQRQETAALTAQNDFLREKARALGDPPCWLDAKNQVDFLFDITVLDDGLLVVPAWPQNRKAAVDRIPVPEKSLNKIITIGEFQREFRRVYDRSKKDVCRYYVGLFNQAKSGDKSTANRSAVENYFYVYLRPK